MGGIIVHLFAYCLSLSPLFPSNPLQGDAILKNGVFAPRSHALRHPHVKVPHGGRVGLVDPARQNGGQVGGRGGKLTAGCTCSPASRRSAGPARTASAGRKGASSGGGERKGGPVLKGAK